MKMLLVNVNRREEMNAEQSAKVDCDAYSIISHPQACPAMICVGTLGLRRCQVHFLDYFVSSLLIRFHQWEGIRGYWRVGRKRVPLSVLQVLSTFPVSKIQLRL